LPSGSRKSSRPGSPGRRSAGSAEETTPPHRAVSLDVRRIADMVAVPPSGETMLLVIAVLLATSGGEAAQATQAEPASGRSFTAVRVVPVGADDAEGGR